MDQYSFLNTAHTAYFAELYDQYLINPEHVEPSWRAFFQGFEFGIEESKKEKLAFEGVEVPDNILKEFKGSKSLLMLTEQEVIYLQRQIL
jgi:2-oxoglutarate dehydrogenase E1 component